MERLELSHQRRTSSPGKAQAFQGDCRDGRERLVFVTVRLGEVEKIISSGKNAWASLVFRL